MLASGIGAPLLITLIAAIPKNPAYAASSRLALVVGAFATATVGLVAFTWARRRYKDTKMLARFGSASSAVHDTLSYLRQEQRLARRGRVPALVGSLISCALYVLAQWPQAAPVNQFQTAFGVAALTLLASVPILGFRNRAARINAFFLRRYLKQQLDHLGFKAMSRRDCRQARRNLLSAVMVVGVGLFRIGDFVWRFDDLIKNVVVFG